uniref:PH domain-containing protein n=1 Tax=Anopheles epiroticus TaxID=199890 RepID=A0A182PI20_9DIPT
MKKFMTTATKTPAAVAAASPSPTSTFSFETMLREQAAARSGSSVPESGEDTAASQPATPTAIQPVTPRPDETSSREVRSVRGATLARLPPTAISDSATPTPASTSPPSSTSTGVVKMCGYLKKKRNKMGGWRKLFFVLQNRLLLSYSSRDDYEKKLAPFKDIINLVPGTIIIPTTGPRFTIETNSKLMYTFRCDDHRCCSEWIMALLDSLTAAANGGLSADRNFSLHNGFHRSTLPLPSYALPSNCQPFAGVVSRSGGPALVLMKRAPQAPASLLVRSGPPKLPRSLQPTETATAAAAVAPAGRSHGPARLSPPESNEDEDDLNNNVLSVGDCLANNSLSKSRDSGAKMPGSGEDGDTR